jgi:phage protein U
VQIFDIDDIVELHGATPPELIGYQSSLGNFTAPDKRGTAVAALVAGLA